jgi:DNA polymerase-4
MFYVQVARLLDPDGAGRTELLIVGGSATGRGVVTSASYPVRAFGVRSGMPTGQALRLCPDATVVPVPRGACLQRSRAVGDALHRHAPVVQAASIDEFYLDLTGTERLPGYADLAAIASHIRESLLSETEISVSIGGSTQRLVAKLAANLAKPGGVRVVVPGQEAEFMRQFDLSQIPGVGPTLASSLSRRGLVTVEDALGVDQVWLERWFGPARGAWLYRRIRGRDSSRVDPHESRKSISSERTFFTDLSSDDDLADQLFRLSLSVGRSLRKQELRARTITVKVRDRDFKTRSASRTLKHPVESDAALYHVGEALLSDLRERRRIPARLLGIGVSNLTTDPVVSQLGLFGDDDAVESDRDRNVARTLDRLRARFGEGVVMPARMVKERS